MTVSVQRHNGNNTATRVLLRGRAKSARPLDILIVVCSSPEATARGSKIGFSGRAKLLLNGLQEAGDNVTRKDLLEAAIICFGKERAEDARISVEEQSLFKFIYYHEKFKEVDKGLLRGYANRFKSETLSRICLPLFNYPRS